MDSPLKITTFGQTTVGKTSIVTRMVHGHCNVAVNATVGASFVPYKHNDVRYNIWDTAGQERFRSLTPMYFRDSRIVIFVFDMSKISTLHEIDRYLENLKDIDNYLIIVVGNKTDLLDDDTLQNNIDLTEIKMKIFPLREHVFEWVFTSATTGENFEKFMTALGACAKAINEYDKLRKINANIPENLLVAHIEKETIIEDNSCSC